MNLNQDIKILEKQKDEVNENDNLNEEIEYAAEYKETGG